MSDCEVCSEHSGLVSSIGWVSKLMLLGFSLVLSSVIYFNMTLQDNMIRLNKEISGYSLLVTRSTVGYEVEIASLSERVYHLEEKVYD